MIRNLNRHIKLLFVIVLIVNISLFAKILDTKGQWKISTGTSVEYTIEEANWTVQYGDLSESGEGSQFDNVKINPSGTFEVEVINVDDQWGVEFVVDNSTEVSTGVITTDTFVFEFVKYLYYPAEECARITTEGFNSVSIKHGPYMPAWFFIEPNQELWDYFDEISAIEFHKTKENNFDFEAYFESFFELRDNQAIFDLHMYGDFINDTLETNMQFDHNIKFVWQESSGILLGYRVNSYLSGEYENQTITENLLMTCKQTEYSLPDFKFYAYTGFIPGYGFGITIISLIFLLTFGFLIKKQKKLVGK
ncbi:MAG TPA: choice-of-anchor S family protein [candidate division Zixibacteria bacterium]|nr:choice-of-anchor S family protein [candidate division Zixibacteria bacterium]